jgi:hypothetical protein
MFEHKAAREILRLNLREKESQDGESYVVTFMILYTTRIIKWKRLRRAEHRIKNKNLKFWSGNSKGRGWVGDLCVDGKVILKLILEKWGMKMMAMMIVKKSSAGIINS